MHISASQALQVIDEPRVALDIVNASTQQIGYTQAGTLVENWAAGRSGSLEARVGSARVKRVREVAGAGRATIRCLSKGALKHV